MKSFNLVDEPWIPIAGEKEPRSLMAVFSYPPPLALGGDPVDKIVLLRLLLTIVHASTDIPDTSAWAHLSEESIAQNARTYLQKHHDLFDLYDPKKPFLQMPQLAEKAKALNEDKSSNTAKGSKKEEETCEKSLANLSFYVASGNNGVVTEWNSHSTFSDIEKALIILRSVGYACGGKRFTDKLILSADHSKKTAAWGTLLGKRGYLHSFLKGKNILQTIHLNLLTDQNISDINLYKRGKGFPIWETMPSGEIDDIAKNYQETYLGWLFPLDKFLLLTDSGVLMTDGIPYKTLDNSFYDPAITWKQYLEKKELHTSSVHVSSEKKPWRDLTALLGFLENKDEHASPYTLSLGLQKMRYLSGLEKFSFWVGGIEVSENSGEQKISRTNDYIESIFEIPLSSLGSNGLQIYKKMMGEAEQISKELGTSVYKYYSRFSVDKKHIPNNDAIRCYWEQMEQHAQEIIALAFQDNISEETLWCECKKWTKVLSSVYNAFCPHDTARQLLAWEHERPKYQINAFRKPDSPKGTLPDGN